MLSACAGEQGLLFVDVFRRGSQRTGGSHLQRPPETIKQGATAHGSFQKWEQESRDSSRKFLEGTDNCLEKTVGGTDMFEPY